MSGSKFTDEFKRDAVAQVEDRGQLPITSFGDLLVLMPHVFRPSLALLMD